jgi:hypothetical protein
VEVDMSRYNVDEFETESDDLSLDGVNRRFAEKDVDQPRRSPIRRKDKMRLEEGMKQKAKKNDRKIQYRIKYELYEESNKKN